MSGAPGSHSHTHSYKCWDERCVHYLYGFSQADDRDHHAREHVLLRKRDSGLSLSGTPPPWSSDHPSRTYSFDHSHPKQTPSAQPSRLVIGGSASSQIQLAPLSMADRSAEGDLRTYSFVSEPLVGGRRGSIDSDVDPLLPPLKRSRVGRSRLESIEELRLLQEREPVPCLRCKVLTKPVSLFIALIKSYLPAG
jgi:hypothetical protein